MAKPTKKKGSEQVNGRSGTRVIQAAFLLTACLSPAAAEVPVKLANGYPMVPVEIAGQQHSMVLDTGAEGMAVYPEFAATMRFPAAPGQQLVGQTGAAELPSRTIASLVFDGRRVGPVTATELPSRSDGLRLPGIVGLDVIGARLLDLDIPAGKVSLLEGRAADTLIAGLGTPTRAKRVTGGLLAVPVQLDGVSGWAVIDTGARESRINETFARAARLAAEDRPLTTVNGATQNPISVRTARVRGARFLGRGRQMTSVRVVNLPVFQTFGFADQPAMLLGIDWLAEHRLLIDFRSGKVWLR
jgi:predicted aspartyl protease